jgi:NTP pyrophosphatase (non-canonical NTP hydrolase)
MELNDYQNDASATAIYPDNGTGSDRAIAYTLLGLAGEAGETCNTWKKWYRDEDENFRDPNGDPQGTRDQYRDRIAGEIGDLLWYLSQAAREVGYTLDEIADYNLKKLKDRQERDQLTGSGDQR